ncbi:hypothetical protein KIW84_022824 [Lathyrus oleraceus]|uniref:Uncharacterized protein n=1 Tax=Pisum sativum TaxID=3888 RepID=A0A9D4YDE5_PEA|nr:hypothetical protein KIW84_022824 [Pisum sativum]
MEKGKSIDRADMVLGLFLDGMTTNSSNQVAIDDQGEDSMNKDNKQKAPIEKRFEYKGLPIHVQVHPPMVQHVVQYQNQRYHPGMPLVYPGASSSTVVTPQYTYIGASSSTVVTPQYTYHPGMPLANPGLDKDSKQKLKAMQRCGQPIPCGAFNNDGSIYAYAVCYDCSKGAENHNPTTAKNCIYLHLPQDFEVKGKPRAGSTGNAKEKKKHQERIAENKRKRGKIGGKNEYKNYPTRLFDEAQIHTFMISHGSVSSWPRQIHDRIWRCRKFFLSILPDDFVSLGLQSR